MRICGATEGDGATSAGSASNTGPSLPLFFQMYEKRCIEFDELHGWEAKPYSRKDWWRHVPSAMRGRVHFYNVPIREGSMRDALSLTDQAIAYGQGNLTGAQVAEMLGTVDRGKALDLVEAILNEDASTVLTLVAQIAEHAPDFVSTIDELSNIFHQMTIAQTVPDALDTSWPDQARIVELAAQATLDDTQLFWQMAV